LAIPLAEINCKSVPGRTRGSGEAGVTIAHLALYAAVVVGWAYLLCATAAARGFARRAPDVPRVRPPMSLLKPLHGAEPGLDENLRSFARQEYPAFQIVLGVSRRSDPALPIARALRDALPQADLAIVVDARARGSNNKVANLENMLPQARHDVIVISDSDIRVGPDYLEALAAAVCDPRIGLVTCLYTGIPSSGLWSRLGALFVNFGFLPGALLADRLRLGNGCFGATMALRREVLDRIGGFARVRDALADDYRLAEAVRRSGLEVVLSRYVVATVVAEPDWRSLWRHEVRWARTTRGVEPAGFLGSALTHPVALAAIAVLVPGFTLTSCAFLVISCLLRWFTARAVARALNCPRQGMWLLPVRDLLSFAVFVASFFGRSVVWRDQQFQVSPAGRMTIDGEEAL
jgi:ceramide glucosyltransferase